jgi:CheY-like chemotaxis protein
MRPNSVGWADKATTLAFAERAHERRDVMIVRPEAACTKTREHLELCCSATSTCAFALGSIGEEGLAPIVHEPVPTSDALNYADRVFSALPDPSQQIVCMPNSSDFANPAVLIVEDEILVRWLVVELFQEAGYEVIEAGDGDEAIRVLADHPEIGVLFTDVHMPGATNGVALAHHARKVCPNCAIIVSSGRGLSPGDELGPGVRFVPKPYRAEHLIRMVDEMLGR